MIADAGPLIAMGRISHFSLLASVLGKIIIPQAVADECLAEIAKPGAHEIQRAINRKDVEIYKNPAIHTYQKWLDLLGPGESAAIMLASQLKTGLLALTAVPTIHIMQPSVKRLLLRQVWI